MPTAWQEQLRLAAMAAAIGGLSLLALTIATTEAALAAIALTPTRPRVRLITLYGRRIGDD